METKINILKIDAVKDSLDNIRNQLNKSCKMGIFNLDEAVKVNNDIINLDIALSTLGQIQDYYIDDVSSDDDKVLSPSSSSLK
jgi:hypothetical protein